MRILYLALIEVEVFNAQRVHTIEVCANLTKLGNDVLLLLPAPRSKKPSLPFKAVYVPFFGWGWMRELMFNFLLCLYFMYYVFKFKPDVVYERMLENPFCLAAARLTGKKHFLEVNGPPHKEGAPLKNLFIRAEIKNTWGIIAPSPKLAGRIRSVSRRGKPAVQFIPNGVNPEIFFPQDSAEAKKRLELSPDFFYIGYTGSLYSAYDFDFVFRSMDRLKNEMPDVRLIILAPEMRVDCPENVLFVKNVSYTQVPLYINAFDACLLPLSKTGINTQDFFARVKLFEYIACGKSVLVPRLSGEETPEDFKRFIISYNCEDADDFLSKVKGMAGSDRSSLKIAKEDALSFARLYSWEQTARKIADFIRDSP